MAANCDKRSKLNELSNCEHSPDSKCSFIHLPIEIINKVFDHLDITSLSRLSLASKTLRDKVCDYCIKPRLGYRRLNNFKDFLYPHASDQDRVDQIDFFQHLGLLLKRLTCLYPTEERLEQMLTFIAKVTSGLPNIESPKKCDHDDSFVLKCLGTFLHTTIIGWDENECIKVFNWIEKTLDLESIMPTVINIDPGELTWCEYFVRCFYRYVCLDRCRRPEDKLFWIKLILSKYSQNNNAINCKNQMEIIAKLLVLLFAPLVCDEDVRTPMIAWAELSVHFFTAELDPLSKYIQLLTINWSDDKIISLIDCIVNLPDPWSPENIASLLHFCGEKFVKVKLIHHLTNFEVSQAANLIVYQIIVSQKLHGVVANNILDLIEECLSTRINQIVKQQFISTLPKALNEAFAELDALIELEEERDPDDLVNFVSAMSSFIFSLLFRHYNNIFYTIKITQI